MQSQTDSILFKNMRMILPYGERSGDLLVKNGKIAAIDWNLSATAELEIHEPHLTLLPGVIDPHVHFREPGHTHKEDLESGSKAAISGGVTSFCEMPNTSPSTTTVELMAQKKQLAAQSSWANYNFFIAAALDNLDELIAVENVPGIKIFMGSSTGNLLVDDPDILDHIFSKTNKLIAIHSEDEATIQANKNRYSGSIDPSDHPRIRSVEAAVLCTQKAIELSSRHNQRLHICHLTTADEIPLITAARSNAPITTEATPQHLLLDDTYYEKLGTRLQINPPVRGAVHREALWQGLINGEIDFVATDHAPHTLEEKNQPFGQAPSGMPGIETSLSLMLTQAAAGRCGVEDVVRWMCEKPANCYKMKNKGQLAVGFDADLVLVDLQGQKQLKNVDQHTKCGWTAFEGWTVTGLPVATFLGGQMVYRENDFFDINRGSEIQFG